jgi:trimeric autotransporter adhesin
LDTTASGFQGNPTVSYVAVAAGKASFAFTANPVTKTGSAQVVASLQTLNSDTGVWADVANSSDTAVINVTSDANAFTGSALASASASISYGVAAGLYSWSSVTVTVRSVNAGASIVVSAPGVIIQDQADAKTYSATATLRANSSGNVALKFASTKAGTHTISYTVGGVTTTSRLVITAAQVDRASKITLAAADVVAGQTTTITGVVADAFDNPVEYTGSDKKLIVSWTGKGLPFNIGSSVNTDETGKFTFQVLVLAGETGAGVASVTFKPTAVASGDVTVTRTYTIAAPPAAVVPEINAVIGSFNGRWAVRVENAKGAVVSVKVGNRWVKYTSLNDNYLFSRKSTVGATLPVAVYVNGQLENVATLTIK